MFSTLCLKAVIRASLFLTREREEEFFCNWTKTGIWKEEMLLYLRLKMSHRLKKDPYIRHEKSWGLQVFLFTVQP